MTARNMSIKVPHAHAALNYRMYSYLLARLITLLNFPFLLFHLTVFATCHTLTLLNKHHCGGSTSSAEANIKMGHRQGSLGRVIVDGGGSRDL
jgi:hypothetical protein